MGRLFERSLVLLALGFLTGGCVQTASTSVQTAPAPARPAAPAPAQPVAAPAPSQTPASTDRHVLIVPALQGVLKVTKVTSEFRNGGYLKIQINIQNMTASRQHFVYRIDWFDSDGVPLPQAAISTPWMLLPREESSLAMTAPTPAAKDFEVALIPEH